MKTTALETAIYRNKTKLVVKLIRHGAKFSLQKYNETCKNSLI